jgi:hypothetical protein
MEALNVLQLIILCKEAVQDLQDILLPFLAE